MDLSLSSEDRALADDAREWLATHHEPPPSFKSLEEEVEWGRRWQAKLASARWVGIHWPDEYGGRGASPVQVALFNAEYARSRAPQVVNRVGINLAGPTLLAHGTAEQRARYLPRILDASEIWCQLFSEPDAGSDLAALTTRAEPTDGGWLISGQKVWTSYAQFAKWGICLARTNPDAPKHKGISYFIVDVTQPGVSVRPLVQITGNAEFNEVFLDDVFVPAENLVGDENNGWRVAATTLAHERGTNFPFKEQVVHEILLDRVLEEHPDTLDDEIVADELGQCYIACRLLALSNLRTLTRLANGQEPGPESSVVKLQWSTLTQQLSDLWIRIAPLDPAAQHQFLWSKAASIAGGTSEVQKDIIGERMLMLPR